MEIGFYVDAGKIESDGEKNYKVCHYYGLNEFVKAKEVYDTCRGYHFRSLAFFDGENTHTIYEGS